MISRLVADAGNWQSQQPSIRMMVSHFKPK